MIGEGRYEGGLRVIGDHRGFGESVTRTSQDSIGSRRSDVLDGRHGKSITESVIARCGGECECVYEYVSVSRTLE